MQAKPSRRAIREALRNVRSLRPLRSVSGHRSVSLTHARGPLSSRHLSHQKSATTQCQLRAALHDRHASAAQPVQTRDRAAGDYSRRRRRRQNSGAVAITSDGGASNSPGRAATRPSPAPRGFPTPAQYRAAERPRSCHKTRDGARYAHRARSEIDPLDLHLTTGGGKTRWIERTRHPPAHPPAPRHLITARGAVRTIGLVEPQIRKTRHPPCMNSCTAATPRAGTTSAGSSHTTSSVTRSAIVAASWSFHARR
jgi:hypothetical protein